MSNVTPRAQQYDTSQFWPQSPTYHWWTFGMRVSPTLTHHTTIWRVSEANLRLLYSQLQTASQTPLSPGKQLYQFDLSDLVEPVLGGLPTLAMTSDALAAFLAGIPRYWTELKAGHPGYFPDGPTTRTDLPREHGTQN